MNSLKKIDPRLIRLFKRPFDAVETGKTLRWAYNRLFYRVSLMVGELRKPLPPSEFWTILTLLAVRGIGFTWRTAFLLYFAMMFVFIAGGQILIWLGIPKDNTTIGNEQNLELLAILEKVKKIDDKINAKT